jgi:hypothetical protein
VVPGGKLTANLGGSAFSNALGVALGALVNYGNIMAAGMPHPFHWDAFSLGLAIDVVSYARGGVA